MLLQRTVNIKWWGISW